jgi:hypothetical protein
MGQAAARSASRPPVVSIRIGRLVANRRVRRCAPSAQQDIFGETESDDPDLGIVAVVEESDVAWGANRQPQP